MKRRHKVLLLLLGLVLLAGLALHPLLPGQPAHSLARSLDRLALIASPAPGGPPRTLTAQARALSAQGAAAPLAGRTVDLAFQAPDRLRVSFEIDRQRYTLGRDGQELWVYAPQKHFGVHGKTGLPRFASAPEERDATRLAPLRLPVSRVTLWAAVLLLKVETQPAETVASQPCRVLRATPRATARRWLDIPPCELRFWLRDSDRLPVRLHYSDPEGTDLNIEFADLTLDAPWPAGRWKLAPEPGDTIETVALAHVARFVPAALSLIHQTIPTLGPARGERRVLATEGAGRLELIDDTRVLFLKGTPEAMGHQHGVLMKPYVRNLVDRILYGVGVGSSFEKGRWFMGEIEQAQSRLMPFVDPRCLREMDAMAAAAGLAKEEIRLANFFPELFHCSGFALLGEATVGRRLYHGRILDYLRGVGLEPNAVVIVHQPDQGHPWVNVGYAGFVGSVTAMNARHISIGEMGGRGEGNWDGKPMAQLVREVMEKASTLDEAVEIMRRGPRTCEYYYVIADGTAHRAVGIAATPDSFQVIEPGQFHPQLPHPMKDTVLMSAGDRYETLAERVRQGLGQFDDDAARKLMERPVAMKSNIQSVLFAPDTLDFWVANADARNVASHTRYTHYNLQELLQGN
ncbi:MAG TPA: C45 family autoproteolytic acyltransferase/hydrolase [Verrucomicrobiota bacterium]|nr:C45 family autoproteolytic acyltransferase/hydrolase [Verrucomicrobiota bacterium]HNU50074.1 C45 family autoproteolytic acyltransferase/hydrolase [Verrucomicrobiota bacterium]